MGMNNTLAEVVSTKNKDTHTLTQSNFISAAIEKMSARNIGALVILGDNDSVVGIFSERDLLKRVAAKGLDFGSTPLSEVMTPDPVCVDTSMTVEQAMREITDNQIRHLPLVSSGKLLGLISSRDLTAWAIKAQKAEIEGLSQKLTSAAAKNKALVALIGGVILLVIIGILTS